MSVFVSNKHMYVQFIDDVAARTVASASTQSAGMSGGKNNADLAKRLGAMSAEAAQGAGVTEVVFDRGGFAYRGKVKVIAEAAREAGLKF